MICVGYSIDNEEWEGIAFGIPILTIGIGWILSKTYRRRLGEFLRSLVFWPLDWDAGICWSLVLCSPEIMVVFCYSVWLLNDYWWLCALSLAPVVLWFDFDEKAIIFINRKNPLSQLLRKFENHA